MAITQAVCTSFKSELLTGVHVLGTDTLKMALYGSSADLSAATTAYTTSGEVTGTGYTAGGKTVTPTITSSGTAVLVDFDDQTWTSSTISARGALIYNSSKSNRAIAVIDFGTVYSTSNAPFGVQFPPVAITTALLRLGG